MDHFHVQYTTKRITSVNTVPIICFSSLNCTEQTRKRTLTQALPSLSTHLLYSVTTPNTFILKVCSFVILLQAHSLLPSHIRCASHVFLSDALVVVWSHVSPSLSDNQTQYRYLYKAYTPIIKLDLKISKLKVVTSLLQSAERQCNN